MPREQPAGELEVGEWRVDPAVDEMRRNGAVVKLEPRTMRLLVRLAESAGQVVSSKDLLDDVWEGVVVGPASVYQAISQLRKLLGDTDPHPTYIATVPRKGYRLIAPVREWPKPVAASRAPAASPVMQPLPGTEVATAPVREGDLRPHALRRWLLAAAAAVVVLLAAAWFFQTGGVHRSASRASSLLVLPFIDLTDDGSNQVFCDGLTEELSSWLSQLPTLRVVARSSAFALGGRNEDVRAIARTVDATHVLEGSVRRSGSQLRVTAQLVNGRTGYEMWSKSFNVTYTDFIGMQNDIARDVATALELRFSEDTTSRLSARRSTNVQAYEAYLEARYQYRQRTPEANARAIDLSEQAIALDPSFAPAHVSLAKAYINDYLMNLRPVAEMVGRVEPLLTTAIRLDPKLADAYATRGGVRLEQSQFPEAESDIRFALQLDPNDAAAHSNLAQVLEGESQPRLALDSFNRAVNLEPLDFMRHFDRCISLHDLGRMQEATLACMRAHELAPDNLWPAKGMMWISWSKGRVDEALEWNRKALMHAPTESILYDDRAFLLLSLGLIEEAKETYANTVEVSRSQARFSPEFATLLVMDDGPAALLKFASPNGDTRLTSSSDLFALARAFLMAGDIARAGQLLDRALAASDLDRPKMLTLPSMRLGRSEALLAAAIEQQRGNTQAAQAWLADLTAVLNAMEQNGQSNSPFYGLRARVLALSGDLDGAMRDLQRAVELGWRDSAEIRQGPQWTPLRARPDCEQLLRTVEELNAAMRTRVLQSKAQTRPA